MKRLMIVGILTILAACASVDITKTSEGYREPSNANNIQIFKTIPKTGYTELGTITVSGFDSKDAAKMHNAIRAKSSGLGADAVILTSEGMIPTGFGSYQIWATGVAIAYEKEKKDSSTAPKK